MIDRILHMIGLARITLVDDSGPIQELQIDEGPIGTGKRVVDKVRRIVEFGFASSPPLSSEVLLLRQGGQRSRTLAVGTNHQPSRLKNLQEGDSAVYDIRGAYIWLTAEGLVIDGATLPVIIRNCVTVTIEGDLHVTGDVVSRSAAGAVSLNTVHDKYNAHHHGGVQSGGSSTGGTDQLA